MCLNFFEVVTLSSFLPLFLVAFPYSLFYVYFIFSLSDAYCSNLFSSQQICRLCSGCLCFQGGLGGGSNITPCCLHSGKTSRLGISANILSFIAAA